MEEPIKCKDCVFWSKNSGTVFGNARFCKLEYEISSNNGFYIYGGDCNDGLYTEPNFGCIRAIKIKEVKK